MRRTVRRTKRKDSVGRARTKVAIALDLSRAASLFVRQHRRTAEIAATAALEGAAAQLDFAGDLSQSDVPASLEPFVVRQDSGDDMIGGSEAAERLGVSRTTVYEWVRKNILLGWKGTKRGLILPAEQILGSGKVVPGIAQLVDIIGDPELVWDFLSEDWPFADEVARPIDKLKRSEVEDVVDAAPSFGTAVT